MTDIVAASLKRVQSNEYGTFGVLSYDGIPRCVTLEDQWLDNIKFKSCIPEGTYCVEAYSGTHNKDVWKVLDVPDRKDILIHIGNTNLDVEGCIAVGERFSQFGGMYGVANSTQAMNMLRRLLPNRFKIKIENCF